MGLSHACNKPLLTGQLLHSTTDIPALVSADLDALHRIPVVYLYRTCARGEPNFRRPAHRCVKHAEVPVRQCCGDCDLRPCHVLDRSCTRTSGHHRTCSGHILSFGYDHLRVVSPAQTRIGVIILSAKVCDGLILEHDCNAISPFHMQTAQACWCAAEEVAVHSIY